MKSRDRVLKLLQIAGPCGLTSVDIGNVCFIHGKTLSVLMKRLVEENAVWVREATYYSHADYRDPPESPWAKAPAEMKRMAERLARNG